MGIVSGYDNLEQVIGTKPDNTAASTANAVTPLLHLRAVCASLKILPEPREPYWAVTLIMSNINMFCSTSQVHCHNVIMQPSFSPTTDGFRENRAQRLTGSLCLPPAYCLTGCFVLFWSRASDTHGQAGVQRFCCRSAGYLTGHGGERSTGRSKDKEEKSKLENALCCVYTIL